MVEWRDVPGYESLYSVSDEGYVFSKRRSKIMSPSTGKWGHLRVVLYDAPRKPKTETVHRLVKTSFDGSTPEGLLIRHENGNPADNRLSNLVFGTYSENMYDKSRHGTDHNRVKTHCPRSHLLVAPNLQAGKASLGWRSCKACHRARSDMHNRRPGTFQELSDRRYALIMKGTDG